MNHFQLLSIILFISFFHNTVLLSAEEGITFTRSKKRRQAQSRERKKPLRQPSQTTAKRRTVPGISNTPPSVQKQENSTAEVITVDKDLQLIIPKKQSSADEIEFVFEPYTQSYITRVIKLFHIILPEVEPSLLKLHYRNNTFSSNVRFLINIRHFMLLMSEHRIFQLRENSLQPLFNLNHNLISNLVIDLQKRPDEGLNELYNFLKELPFEDVFCLKTFYEALLDHIQKDGLNTSTEAYEWIEKQLNLSFEEDSLHTYKYFLDKRPVRIMDQFLKSAQILYYENLQDLLPVSSKIYLQYSQQLLDELKLLDTDKAVMRRLELHLEFSRLQFEPFENNSKIYENLMSIYPKIAGSKDYFASDPQRANLVFPFFDQLINYAERRFERGRNACQDPIVNDKEVCLQHWREATQIYQYVAKFSPHSVTTSKAIERLQEIHNNQVLDYPFINQSELLDLIDESRKPHL